MVAEEASEWRGKVWFLERDLFDAFGSMGFPLIRKILELGPLGDAPRLAAVLLAGTPQTG